MWWLWCSLSFAGVSDDLAVIQQAGRAIVADHAARGCDLPRLRIPARTRTPEQQAAAVEHIRTVLTGWRHPEACSHERVPAGALVELEAPGPTADLDAQNEAWLIAQGHPEAAARWSVLASRSRREADTPGGCACMGEPVRGTPIVYGYPSQRMVRQYERGKIVLGGCVVSVDAPRTRCPVGCRAR